MNDQIGSQYYPIPLVGEQYYQLAVFECRVGDIVDIYHEIGNPHDEQALVVRRQIGGKTLGYISRDSFVQRVVHMEGRGVAAAVREVRLGDRGFYELILIGSVGDFATRQVQFRA